eukprot:185986_1
MMFVIVMNTTESTGHVNEVNYFQRVTMITGPICKNYGKLTIKNIVLNMTVLLNRSSIKYWPLLLIATCIIFFSLDSLLLYNHESSLHPPQSSSNNMYVIINNNDANTVAIDQHKMSPQRRKDRAAIQPNPDDKRRQHIIDNLTWALRPANRQITLIVNSCGRLDLLRQTISSFERYYPHDKYPLYEKIIIDDSRNASIAHQLIDSYYPDYEIILTANNAFEAFYTNRDERITFAMDKIYGEVITPWIYHIEDDWIFSREGWIDESFDIFEASIPSQYQTAHNWSNDHFFYDPHALYSVVLCWNMYRQRVWCNRTYLYEYKGSQWYNMNYHLKRGVTWGGFSFNAGLQQTFLYQMYGKFMSPKGEWGKSEQMIKDGLKVALMAPPACDHIGKGRHVDSGELLRAD